MNLDTRLRYTRVAREAAKAGQDEAAKAILELVEQLHFVEACLASAYSESLSLNSIVTPVRDEQRG